jgi:hypothetical protein
MTRSLFPSVRWSLAAVALATGLLGLTGQAHASKTQESILQDDRLLQSSDQSTQTGALDDLKKLGVTTVHAVVSWNGFVPASDKATQPSSFDGTDPADYNQARLAVLDRLVQGANQRGIQVLLSPAGPAPKWALTCTTAESRKYGKEPGTCKPDPKLFGQFVTVLAKRYNGSGQDANGNALPKVKRWSIWNEANLNSWISPQIVSIRGNKVPVGAAVYRNLAYSAITALRGNGHASDQILLGETAPIGQGTVRTSPATFYRAVFCIDQNGKRLTGAAAKNLQCPAKPKKLAVTGIAHHPYTQRATQPILVGQRKNDITLANLNVLTDILKQGAKAKMVKRNLPIYLTEFGVSSRPPAKRGYGVTTTQQADWINEAEFISYLNKTVQGLCQFQLDDDSNLKTKSFQTGLRTNGKAKNPTYAAYQVPLYVADRGTKLQVFGGVRGQKTGTVSILNGGKEVKTAKLRSGYFLITLPKKSGTWQLSYKAADGSVLKSRVAKAEKLPKGF